MCCIVGFIETNHAVCLSVRVLIAGRHFAHMHHLSVTSIESTAADAYDAAVASV